MSCNYLIDKLIRNIKNMDGSFCLNHEDIYKDIKNYNSKKVPVYELIEMTSSNGLTKNKYGNVYYYPKMKDYDLYTRLCVPIIKKQVQKLKQDAVVFADKNPQVSFDIHVCCNQDMSYNTFDDFRDNYITCLNKRKKERYYK